MVAMTAVIVDSELDCNVVAAPTVMSIIAARYGSSLATIEASKEICGTVQLGSDDRRRETSHN
jgi:hypothetical protein